MQLILPVYLVLDTSASMEANRQGVQGFLEDLRMRLLEDPLTGDIVRVAIVTFSDDARLLLPLSDITLTRSIPNFSFSSRTFYGPALRVLLRAISRDLRLLQSNDTKAFAPVILFITDGKPVDPEAAWLPKVDELKSKYGARLIGVNVGAEDIPALRRMGGKVYRIPDFRRLTKFLSKLTRSYTSSTFVDPRNIKDLDDYFPEFNVGPSERDELW